MRAARAGTLLALVAAAGWSGAHLVGSNAATNGSRRPPTSPPSREAFDSATVAIRGELTPAARSAIRQTIGDGGALLVLLDSADIRVCEDLGRQLRELRNRAGPAMPLVVVTDSGALIPVRAFARRERLHSAGWVTLGAGHLIAGVARVPTPATLVFDRDGVVVGIGHPRRFANVRTRSFADELSLYLPTPAGSASPPEPRRIR